MSQDAVLNHIVNEGVELALLPPQIRMLANTIGLHATLALLRARGGTPYTVPVHGDRSKFLTSIMSVDSARALSASYGWQTLTLPKLDKAMIQIRNRRIQQEATNGESLATLARRYNLTTRQISNILSTRETITNIKTKQGSLFDL
jgi:hypothetical protein